MRSSFPALSICRMCALLKIGRALVYRVPAAPRATRPALLSAIERIVQLFLGYGYRRVHRALAAEGLSASVYEVRAAMREHGLLARRPRTKGLTRRNPADRGFANLIRGLAPEAPDRVWAADLTAIRTASGAVYMASIVDLYSRRVLAHHLSRNPDARLALTCLEKALASRRPAPGWVHHSDRGSTYTAREYVSRVVEAGGSMSMSRTATPTDNAVMESFYRTLKVEEVRPNRYSSFSEAESSLSAFVRLYNERRMHSSLNYLSPDQFEARAGDQGR